ncbi:hypothetical protein PISMIDRAFT_676249 [Pisolithus microcarpus 441]|uniref:Uncharacterized protein n=1 Tax=Pisolithus microcarpus 441 TaxID=765257 RepID=A0A0D0A2Y1_9AGAM|nr:hypothetical protein PISMIDRAFT_676249 [Pisolithus microcarpus 441]
METWTLEYWSRADSTAHIYIPSDSLIHRSPPASLVYIYVVNHGFSRARYPACTAPYFQSSEKEEIYTVGFPHEVGFNMRCGKLRKRRRFRVATRRSCCWTFGWEYCEQQQSQFLIRN